MNTGDARDSWCEYEEVVIAGLAASGTTGSSIFRCGDPPRADSGAVAQQVKQVRGPGVDVVLNLGNGAANLQLSMVGAATVIGMASPKTLWTIQLPGGATYFLPEVLAAAVPGIVVESWAGFRSPCPYWRLVATDKGVGQPATSWMFVRAGGWP